MKSITLLAVFLMFIVVIAQATPVQERAPKKEIGKNLYTTGVRFEGLYKKVANQLLEVHGQYKSLFDSFDGDVKAAAQADNLPVPKFFDSWQEKYVAKAKDAHSDYISFLSKLHKFRKTLDEKYKDN